MNTILVLRLALVGAALAAEPSDAVVPETTKATPSDQFISGQIKGDAHRGQVDTILDSKIDLKYHEMPLLDVLEGMRAKAGLNFFPETKAIEQERADALQSPITIDVKGMTVRSVLHLILRDSHLAWFYRDEAIVITTDAVAWTALETRIYPVGDLIRNTDREVLVLNCTMQPPRDRRPTPTADVDSLIETITTTVAPNNWSEVGGTASIQFVPFALSIVVTQRRECHEEIEALLANLREARKTQLGSLPQPDPSELLLASYAMPRHAPIWTPPLPGYPGSGYNAPLYEAELKTSLANAAATAKEFAVVIPQVIEPANWKTAGGKGEIFVVNDRLVIRQTAAVHAQVTNLLRENSPPGQGAVGNTGNTGS